MCDLKLSARPNDFTIDIRQPPHSHMALSGTVEQTDPNSRVIDCRVSQLQGLGVGTSADPLSGA